MLATPIEKSDQAEVKQADLGKYCGKTHSKRFTVKKKCESKLFGKTKALVQYHGESSNYNDMKMQSLEILTRLKQSKNIF